jgi:hypothetical protein
MTLPELLEYVKAGGGILAPVFAILWWLERGERQDSQTELKQVSEKSVVAITELKSLIGQLATIFKPNGGP